MHRWRNQKIKSHHFLIGSLTNSSTSRVLDLTRSFLESLPDSLGKLKHLRYLRLVYCVFIKELPNSICDLHNLQFLHVRGCKSLITLPKNMGIFLVSLRNFFVTTKDKDLSYIDIGHFKYLQILMIENCDYLVSLPRDLCRLITLKKLIIRRCPELVSFGDEDEEEEKLMESSSLQMFAIWHMSKMSVLPYWLTRYGKNTWGTSNT